MTQKFDIATEEGSLITLEYDDVKTKKLVGFCESVPIKSLGYAGFAAWLIAGIVFVYDFFKDIGRNISATKDLFNGNQGGFSKYLGFTKGNISRYIVTIGLFVLGGILFYLSSAMGEKACFGRKDIIMLETLEQLIKYNNEGKPVEIVMPKK